MNGNELIADILKAEGVEWMACYPSNPLIEAVAKVGIRPIAFRHERGAVMAADGFSRTSDRQRFGVVAIQNQAGAENALGGIAQANADNIPILVLPGGVSLDRLPVRPNYSAVRAYGPVVKRVEALYRPQQVSAAMRRAFSALRNGVPGPVVVKLTSDVCAEEVPEEARSWHSPKAAVQVPHPFDVDAAAAALLAAKRPFCGLAPVCCSPRPRKNCDNWQNSPPCQCSAPCPASRRLMNVIPCPWVRAAVPPRVRRTTGWKPVI
jgi:thiamine pyrophosphate-dependent acetolactate synthase large subunit-like protein